MNEPSAPEHPAPPIELPPVEPPSARFIVQLFLIPLGIVIVLVIGLSLVYMAFGKLATGGHDTAEYIRTIRMDNENRRWRAAYELASLIHNDPKLASDPALLGDLTDLLEQELNHPKPDATKLAEFLALSLGSFQTLKAQATSGRAPDPIETLARALDAVQPVPVRVAAAVSLSRQAERTQGNLGSPSALAALSQAAESGDAQVRARAAYALGYFNEPKAADTLARLTEDVDRTIRFNAAAALARLGDPRARRTLREMLSPADLAGNGEGESASEAKARAESIELEALWALQSAVKAHRPALAQSLRKDLEALSASSSPNVRVEVKDLLKNLPSAP